jgi:hypothetical protein
LASAEDQPTESLAQPADDEEIYGARGEDVLVARPTMQGDVFAGVTVAGYEGTREVAVLSHPCTMRGPDGQLKPRLTAAAVIDYQYLPPHRWPQGHYGVFPLPALCEVDGQPRHAAVAFEEVFAVEATELVPSRRISFLSSSGIYLFQQRHLCCLSRVVVPLARIREACEHVLEEADLLEEWLERLAPDETAITTETAAFTTLLDGGLREQLADPSRRSQARREVTRAITERERERD